MQLELITPQDAKEILEKSSFKNRRLNKNNKDRLAKIMLAGNFHGELAEPIAITKDGDLINGQHRLEAVIQSGVTQNMIVVRDADPEAFKFLDNVVKPRTNADIVAMSEFSQYAPEKAAAFRIYDMYKIKSTQIGAGSKLTGGDVLQMIEDYGDEHVNNFAKATAVLSGVGLRKSTTLAGLMIGFESDKENSERLSEWVNGITKSKNLYDNDPRTHLLKYGLGSKGKPSNQTTFIEDFAFYREIWNKWVAGAEVKRAPSVKRNDAFKEFTGITAYSDNRPS